MNGPLQAMLKSFTPFHMSPKGIIMGLSSPGKRICSMMMDYINVHIQGTLFHDRVTVDLVLTLKSNVES